VVVVVVVVVVVAAAAVMVVVVVVVVVVNFVLTNMYVKVINKFVRMAKCSATFTD